MTSPPPLILWQYALLLLLAALEIISQAISTRSSNKTFMINLSSPLTGKVTDRACHVTEILFQHTTAQYVMTTEEGQCPPLQIHNLSFCLLMQCF